MIKKMIGKLWFNNVKIPREHLLNAFSDVKQGGEFSSNIKKKRARFLVQNYGK